jgi:hypothetical protein
MKRKTKTKAKRAPKGYHRMPNGKLMKGASHGGKKKKASKKKKRGY